MRIVMFDFTYLFWVCFKEWDTNTIRGKRKMSLMQILNNWKTYKTHWTMMLL